MQNSWLLKNLNLGPNEKIKMILRRYILVYFWKGFLVFILILLPFFLLYPLFQWETWGPVIFFVLFFLGLFGAARLISSWYFNVLVVTSQRLVDFDQSGLFDRTVSETYIDKITDISYRRKGLAQSIFNFGTIQYFIPPGQVIISVGGIKRPQLVCQAIINILEKGHGNEVEAGGINTVSQLKDLLEQIKNEVGDEGFKKIVLEVDHHQPPKPRRQDEELRKFYKD